MGTFAEITDRARLADMIARMVSCGCAPVALWGAGRVARQLREGWKRADLDEHTLGIIDDDPAKRGARWAGLPVIGADEALSRGVRAVIITAEGEMQDAMWAARARFTRARAPGGEAVRVLCCPERFSGKTWDDCLIDHYEFGLAHRRGVERTYDRAYPAKDDPPNPELVRVLRDRMPPGGGVCEIGSGAGKWTATLIDRAGPGGYHCVDYSERLLFEVIEHRFAAFADRLRLHHDEAAKLAGVPDASIDLVFSCDVFVHFKIDLVHQFLTAIRRVLKPAGRAVLHMADWNREEVRVWREHFTKFHDGGTTPIHPVHIDWLRVSGGEIGLSVERLPVDLGWGYLAELRPTLG